MENLHEALVIGSEVRKIVFGDEAILAILCIVEIIYYFCPSLRKSCNLAIRSSKKAFFWQTLYTNKVTLMYF